MKSCNSQQLHFGARELCFEGAGCRTVGYLLEQNDVCLLVTCYYMSNSQVSQTKSSWSLPMREERLLCRVLLLMVFLGESS